jgi:hypothetical protein
VCILHIEKVTQMYAFCTNEKPLVDLCIANHACLICLMLKLQFSQLERQRVWPPPNWSLLYLPSLASPCPARPLRSNRRIVGGVDLYAIRVVPRKVGD